jgi:ubiquinol-cytochrome c reductase cytochrome b subunit
MSLFSRVTDFFYDRLGLERFADFIVRHPVPPGNVEGRIRWAYVLGASTLTAFLLQVLTGVALATQYIPSAAHAYESLVYINQEVWLGWMLRGMHYFGASAMIVLISLHMARVFLTASYKYPRELNWVFGVLLLLFTLLMAATGQLLRWDENGIWTVSVGAQLLARVPLVGGALAQFVLAGNEVGGATLSRFFAFHVLIIPAMIFITVGVHVYLVMHHGISEPPEPGRPVDPETYRAWYEEHTEKGGYRYWPDAAWREVVASVVVVAVVVTLALIFGPKGPHAAPDPTTIGADPRPDWYFRWYYALLAVKPRGLETFTMVYLPALIGLFLLALPFVANKGERSPRRRPWAIALVGLVIVLLAVLTELGMRAPWAMRFDTEPIPAAVLGFTEGPVWDGSRVFHERGCQYCHAVAGFGGAYGPDLTDVTRRLPAEVFVTRTVQGFGDMPGYGQRITREELASILTFLRSVGERP